MQATTFNSISSELQMPRYLQATVCYRNYCRAPRRSLITDTASSINFLWRQRAQEKRCFSRAIATIEKAGVANSAVRRSIGRGRVRSRYSQTLEASFFPIKYRRRPFGMDSRNSWCTKFNGS